MKIKYGIVLLSLVVLLSCKKEGGQKSTATPKDSIAYSETTVDTTASKSDEDTLQKVDNILFVLQALKEDTQDRLKKATKEQGNEVYEIYAENSQPKVAYLNQLEDNFLSNYASFYNDDQKKYVFPDSLLQHVSLITKSDLEFQEVGEGYAEIRFKPDHYYLLFKGKVTNDYEQYLKKEAQENKLLYMADASILIPINELADRVLYWEKFIATYPKSPLLDRATKKFQSYGYDYLIGADNSPTFEYADGTLSDDSRKEFKRFIAKNPNSPFAQVCKAFLEKFKQKTTAEALEEFVKKELHIVDPVAPDPDTP